MFTNISTSFWYLLLLRSSLPVLKKLGKKLGKTKAAKKSSRIAQLDGELIRAGERAIQLLQQTTKRFSFSFFFALNQILCISQQKKAEEFGGHPFFVQNSAGERAIKLLQQTSKRFLFLFFALKQILDIDIFFSLPINRRGQLLLR